MASLFEIVAYADDFLCSNQFKDYCPNGLQIEGKFAVNKMVSGVTASQALIDGAIDLDADLILVHHGFFWRGEQETITGLKKKRIHALLKNNVSLLVYHLPLDAHAQCGNNVQLAKQLSLHVSGQFGEGGNNIGVITEVDIPLTAKALFARLEGALGRQPTHLSAHVDREIKKVAICTGGAQNYFEAAIASGVDAFITGEVSEQNFHLANESGVDFFAAGHHATERYGVQSLGGILAKKFHMEHEFLDINNPV